MTKFFVEDKTGQSKVGVIGCWLCIKTVTKTLSLHDLIRYFYNGSLYEVINAIYDLENDALEVYLKRE